MVEVAPAVHVVAVLLLRVLVAAAVFFPVVQAATAVLEILLVEVLQVAAAALAALVAAVGGHQEVHQVLLIPVAVTLFAGIGNVPAAPAEKQLH